MTRDEIMKLSDAELVRACAEHVLGWTVGTYSMKESAGEVIFTEGGDPWCPLADWNHAFYAVTAMRERGWHLEIYQRGAGEAQIYFVKMVAGVGPLFESATAAHGDERRAILQAALLAVGGEQ